MLSEQYWKRSRPTEVGLGPGVSLPVYESVGTPREELAPGSRVAITDFSIEFVDVQTQQPFKRQPKLKLMALPIGKLWPIGTGVEITGLSRRVTTLSPKEREFIADTLYAAFERSLRESGLAVVPKQEVVASVGHAMLNRRPDATSSLARFLNPVSSDTGVALRIQTVAASGLGAATYGAVAATQIRAETGADAVMSVRLRVGTYRNKSALEQFSTIQWEGSNGPVRLTARRALLSDGDVVDSSRFILIAGRVESIAKDRFLQELEGLLPTFVGLAFPSLPMAIPSDGR